jgi:hypothetical protein
MKLRTEEVKFKNGKTITITEETWNISMLLSEGRRKSVDNPLDDRRLQYFRDEIYIVLFSPASGDNVPSLEEAYLLLETSPEDLNEWFKVVQRINPGWFAWLQHHDSEMVTFSDETSLVVEDANVPTGIMRIRDLENDPGPADRPLVEAETVESEIFKTVFYPKLAACSAGQVPDRLDAQNWPTAELNKWYEAVNRVNPQWFKPLIDMKAEVDAQEIKKKKPSRKRRK